MKLVAPSTDLKKSFIEAVKEYQIDTEYPLVPNRYAELSIPELEKDFNAFVEKQLGFARGENLEPGYIPHTDLWLVDGNEFIGRVSVRQRLTEQLRAIGGHIGYNIRPSKRKLGYGSKILELALVEAKKLGVTHVLLTCDLGNVGSQKIIEKNGGIFENQVSNPETGVDKKRFWIDVK